MKEERKWNHSNIKCLIKAREGRKRGRQKKKQRNGQWIQKVTNIVYINFSSVQSLSRVQLFVTPCIAACQASLSITNSRSSLRLMSIELVMPSRHLILCRPLLLLPPIPPSIRVFYNESTLHMRWPKYWSYSFVSPSISHEVMGPDAMIFVFWMLSFKPTFSLSSFTFIKRLFSSSSLSAIRVVSSAYLRLLICLPAILIPACASYSPVFPMMYST